MKNLKIITLASVILLNNNVALASSAEDRYFYIGTELGLSEPVVKNFSHKVNGLETKMRLKQSKMYGGRVGYSFYPNMSIEISATHQPKYRLQYKLPLINITSSVQGGITQYLVNAGAPLNLAQTQAAIAMPYAEVPSIEDITKVSSNVITLNFMYEFEKQALGIKPYVIFGAGVAQVNIRPMKTIWTPAANLAALNGPRFKNPIEFFRIKKNNQNYFAYQFGGGISKDISDHFSIDLGAKLQVIKDIKIKYEQINITTQQFEAQKPIKKTIGVGEFTLGFTFKIPVK